MKQEDDMRKYNKQVSEDLEREKSESQQRSANPVLLAAEVPVFETFAKGNNED